ncbi:MAG: hypothetical protein V4636_02260 [Pseudomonadota bacterium]
MNPALTTAQDAGRFTGGALPPPSFDSFGWPPTASMAKAISGEGIPFVYHGWQFSLRAEADTQSGFRPVVFWRMHGTERMTLPTLRERFDTETAALRCAESQAVRWVREHMGYSQHSQAEL